MELISIIILLIVSSMSVGQCAVLALRVEDDAQIMLLPKLVVGLSFYYLLVLFGLPLSVILPLLWLAPILVILWYGWSAYKGTWRIKFTMSPLNILMTIIFVAGASYLSGEVLKLIAHRPINEWDARSIWYFRAHQLYCANGLNANTGIAVNEFTTRWAHPEYPFLVPTFAALIAKSMGFWNEFMPKTNLYILWFGMLLGIAGLKHIHILLRLVVFAVLFVLSPEFLTIGYNDIWLGTFISIAILHLILYIQYHDTRYITSTLSIVIFCFYLKNDALLLAIALFVGLGISVLATRQLQVLKNMFAISTRQWALWLLLLLPFVMWTYHKSVLHVGNSDYDFGRLARFSEYSTTFAQSKIDLIYNSFVAPMALERNIGILILVVLGSYGAAILMKSSPEDRKSLLCLSVFPISATCVFTVGMFVIYCLSKADLAWHLSTSADRLRMHLMFLQLPTLFAVGVGLTSLSLPSGSAKKSVTEKKRNSPKKRSA